MRAVWKVAGLDAALLACLYLVLQDLDSRLAYAESEGFKAYFEYSILIRWSVLSKGNTVLKSPPALDWVQVISLILILVNASFVYSSVRRRR